MTAKAAALGFSLIQNHPLVDGNKRIGHAAMETTLVLNGVELSASEAMKDALGKAATEEVIDAWSEAYNALADIFIDTDAKLYKKNDAFLVEKLNIEKLNKEVG